MKFVIHIVRNKLQKIIAFLIKKSCNFPIRNGEKKRTGFPTDKSAGGIPLERTRGIRIIN